MNEIFAKIIGFFKSIFSSKINVDISTKTSKRSVQQKIKGNRNIQINGATKLNINALEDDE